MERMYCFKCNKSRQFKRLKVLYIFNDNTVPSIIYNKCNSNDGKYLKKIKNQLRY